MRFVRYLFIATVLLASLVTHLNAAQLINVTGNGVELTYVSVDCNNENETGVVVSGTGFVGKQIEVLNCAGGGFSFGASATLINSLALSAGADITVSAGEVTGLNNLFGDAGEAGAGTYTSATTLFSSSYAARIDTGSAIALVHVGSDIVGGDACGNAKLFGLGVDIGACEEAKFLDGLPAKVWDTNPEYYTVPE